MSSEGYPAESSLHQQEVLSINHYPNIQNILETGKAQSVTIEDDRNSMLPNCQRQTIIPINRENAPIGVIILEMLEADPIEEETIEFLIRLSDHASIAIANADLYSQVQSANIAKSEFVSFVSHELKNPMTSIKGYTDLLLAKAVGPVTEAQDNFLNTIRSNVERMNVLVSDLSDVSRIEAGRLRLDFAKLDLKKLMDEVIRSQSAMIERKGQQLVMEIEENLPPIWADRYRVVQIITNLVSNANKYTGQNGIVTFSAEQSPNIWDAEGAPNVVHIAVKDNGMGISAEDQAMIFQKFFRTESAKSSDMPGTGLGLNITKNLVEMQGGTIWFESTLGEGTTFHVTFPVAD
jgi:signal transduction histidine kinase